VVIVVIEGASAAAKEDKGVADDAASVSGAIQ
jgi:hypothetical protein